MALGLPLGSGAGPPKLWKSRALKEALGLGLLGFLVPLAEALALVLPLAMGLALALGPGSGNLMASL